MISSCRHQTAFSYSPTTLPSQIVPTTIAMPHWVSVLRGQLAAKTIKRILAPCQTSVPRVRTIQAKNPSKGGTMRAALPREGGIADQHDKRKQPSEIRSLTSQRGVKPGKNSCLSSHCAITFSVSKKGS
jgi:hypothetical protein